jgi:NAD(P) transhydrogenase
MPGHLHETFDLVVIGSGPAGQQAAIHAARHGLRTAICEERREVGGACVHHGTIPSKTLRERALRRVPEGRSAVLDQSVSVAELIGEVGTVIRSHDAYMTEQLVRHGVSLLHGRASFESPGRLHLRMVGGGRRTLDAARVVIATGSVPRRVPQVPVDHEHVYDSDSILSLAYLPRSLVVLGGGVVACEYASIFALLGVEVTLVDRAPQPLGFLDETLIGRYLEALSSLGGRFCGGAPARSAVFDGVDTVVTTLEDGRCLRSDKVLCALGRVSRVAGLGLDRAGVTLGPRELIEVNGHGQTSVPNIYAAGDVIGPPALASASMEQGRRAACHMLGMDPGSGSRFIPTGIYAIPELACIGATEAQARAEHAGVVVGEARFSEIARGHIAGTQSGYLKLVVSGDRRLRGVHVAGVQATELVHMGQMALLHEASVDVFIDNVFNFPTYGESFRVAALNAAAALATSLDMPDDLLQVPTVLGRG